MKVKIARKAGTMKKGGGKAGSSSTLKAADVKRPRVNADSLKWKAVKTASFAGMDEGGGMMMLEELDGVDVEWEQDDNGSKIARFVKSADETSGQSGKKSKKGKGKEREVLPEPEDQVVEGENDVSRQEQDELPTFNGISEDVLNELDEETGDTEPDFDDASLPDWKDIPLHNALKKAFLSAGFTKPTEIQARSLPRSLAGKDVIGVAETGSGKTLAYSLPILSHLLSSSRPSSSSSGRRHLSALILCPTRELALQVMDSLNSIVSLAVEKKAGPPRISVGSIIGGLSAQKQKRVLERGCDILVATPGRLWDLMKADDELGASIRGLRFLVIDEADRMIENGHFAELENIVRLTERQQQAPVEEDDPVFAAASNALTSTPANEEMQTFIFSATLSKDLQHNLKRQKRTSRKGSNKATALEDLVERLDFRDPDPEVIDLSPEGGVVRQLKESMIDCVTSEKDLYLYYFLLRYPGRSLVFVGSIDGIRRLTPLFEVLQLPVYPLHSQLQQKQRLKNLDRFKSSKNGILIATDVAARGLDIPLVDHVIHFNLPRTADAYIHRSGRTARAQNPGFALLLCSAEEKGVQRALMKSLGRTTEMPELQIESGFLPKLKERITLAKDIEKAQHLVKKENHDRNWLQEAAEAMDLDIDPGMMSEEDDPDLPYHSTVTSKSGAKTSKKRSAKVESLKAELKAHLAEPLLARGISTRYPTSGSKVIVDDLLQARGHGTLLGASTNKAYDEVQIIKRSRTDKAKSKAGPKANTRSAGAPTRTDAVESKKKQKVLTSKSEGKKRELKGEGVEGSRKDSKKMKKGNRAGKAVPLI